MNRLTIPKYDNNLISAILVKKNYNALSTYSICIIHNVLTLPSYRTSKDYEFAILAQHFLFIVLRIIQHAIPLIRGSIITYYANK